MNLGIIKATPNFSHHTPYSNEGINRTGLSNLNHVKLNGEKRLATRFKLPKNVTANRTAPSSIQLLSGPSETPQDLRSAWLIFMVVLSISRQVWIYGVPSTRPRLLSSTPFIN
jgi:hypothetical protein